MTIDVRSISSEQLPSFRQAQLVGMGLDPSSDDIEAVRGVFELGRSQVAFEGKRIIGTLGCVGFQLSLPGGIASMAGTTNVAVLPTHRRRGVMRKLMMHHFGDARDHGEYMLGLWASQSSIYGRFGYGAAAQLCDLSVEAQRVRVAAPHAEKLMITLEPIEKAEQPIVEIYEQARRNVPGMTSRSPQWWRWRRFHDPPSRRGGASSYLFAIARDGSRPVAYAQYRRSSCWREGLPEDELILHELVGLTPRSEIALWNYLLSIDLVSHVRAPNCPRDQLLSECVDEPRRVKQRYEDSLWIRPLKISDMLAARTYRHLGKIRIHVQDDCLPEVGGTFQLDGGPDGAECRRVEGSADISLDVSTLGRLVLGGSRATTLARVGLIEGDHPAVRTMDSMFLADRSPWCPDKF